MNDALANNLTSPDQHHLPRPRLAPGAAALRVLASGSSGNASILLYDVDGWTRFSLIDAGLSPKRIMPMINRCGLTAGQLDAIILTHLDHDHWHAGWIRGRPPQARVILAATHAKSLGRRDRLSVVPVDGPLTLAPGLSLTPHMADHDDHGVTAFRFDLHRDHAPASLGFATDLGRVPDTLVHAFRGVDVLAIESNYCPQMQLSSSRPWFLKQRIMGGAGHLSNEQALAAIEAIGPRQHVVLLHLSRECNNPQRVAELHGGSDYAITIAQQDTMTRWIRLAPAVPDAIAAKPRQLALF